MNVWQKSDLIYGEQVKIPNKLFVSSEAHKRLISANYVGENDNGIMIDCVFKPAVNTMTPETFHYRMFINWASISCGDVHVLRMDGEMVRAKRVAKERR